MRFVVGPNASAACYDANGNMTWRLQDGVAYEQTWDYENRLASVTDHATGQTTTFTYDGNGVLVKKAAGGVTTVYIGSHYEKQGSTVIKYYSFNGRRIAMNKAGVVYWLAGDHLGTTSLVLNSSGNKVAEARHYPYGGERWSSDTLPTDYRFTGARQESGLGLYHMGARFYDPSLARWLSADTLVPEAGNPQAFNRYSYAGGNPVRYRDPSGHFWETLWDIANVAWDIHEVKEDPSLLNIGCLVVDVTAVVIPVVPGGAGLLARSGKAAVKVATHGDEVVDAIRAAGHLGDATHLALRADEALKAANRLREVGAHTDEGVELIKKIAKLSTDGPLKTSGNTVVLGKFVPTEGFMSYIDKAHQMGAVYFNTPSADVWKALDNPWLVNKQFLDDAIARGDRFFVEADISAVLTGDWSYLQEEIRYLLEAGYRFDGQWLIKP